ncbi:hypothetical protein V1227_25785 [Lentzea sp. DG1S-22]|uniref:hypothetical protein n=1 Tax=Lentzea sp. DG1S-22 TaxID=3108822 RepID=UPI002E7A9A32|nr:hypothetical protein [Lentzea sp. DG1S-22]WVH78471.1 hypothetical protein V1227_25785 [Lentzea sp. DG1S-22]
MPYLRGALAPDRLPAPQLRPRRPATLAPAPAVVDVDQERSGEKLTAEQARAAIAANLKATKADQSA